MLTFLYTRRAMWLTAGLVGLIYLLALAQLPMTVFWSADEGAKYLQMQTLRGWQGGGQYDLPYLGRDLDPDYLFYPQHPIYPQPKAGGQIQFHWSIWFPLLSFLPYSVWNLSGLYLIPMLSGLGVTLFSADITRRFHPPLAPLTVLVVGLSTPILFYSLLFWEHTLTVLLAMGGLWLMFDLPSHATRSRWLRIGGSMLLLMMATMLRLELLVFMLSLGLSVALSWSRHVQPILSQKWLTRRWHIPIIVLIIIGLTIYLIQPLSHSGLIGPRLNKLLTAFAIFVTDDQFWRMLPQHLNATWLNSSASSGPELAPHLEWLGLFALALSGISLICYLLRSITMEGDGRFTLYLIRLGHVCLILSSLLLGWVSFQVLILPDEYRTIHGLFLPAPALILALTMIPYTQQVNRFEATLLTYTSFIYLIFGTLAVLLRQAGIIANLEWGPRYMLLLYPLLITCMLVGINHTLKINQTLKVSKTFRVLDYLLVGVTCLLLLIGAGYQLRGLRTVQEVKADLLPYVTLINQIDQPIVTDLPWLPSVLSVTYAEREIYVLESQSDLHAWLEHAQTANRDSFAYIGFFLLNPQTVEQAPVTIHQQEQELWHGLTVTYYEIE
ncbi:hypothetical protein QUF63_15715 [Anaerolineales bacterium HSG25]|nr:hypothetical protein [Anaerolineales bacterium HSG25]